MYSISNVVIDAKKLEKDFSFCGVFSLDNVDITVVKYLLRGRNCDFDCPTEITFDNIRSYHAPNGGEIIYVKDIP